MHIYDPNTASLIITNRLWFCEWCISNSSYSNATLINMVIWYIWMYTITKHLRKKSFFARFLAHNTVKDKNHCQQNATHTKYKCWYIMQAGIHKNCGGRNAGEDNIWMPEDANVLENLHEDQGEQWNQCLHHSMHWLKVIGFRNLGRLNRV